MNRPRAFIIYNQVILVGENVPNRRDMPLIVSDGLPASEFFLGDYDTHKFPYKFYPASCASMNTDNLLFHLWLVKKYPDIVDPYEYFDDKNPFRPIVLAGPLDNDDMGDFES